MGVYFEYDFKNGKEVEKTEKCYICGKDNVVYAEYYILEGDVYKLYKDARKIIKGKELQVGSHFHPLCSTCENKYPSEEELISTILNKRLDEKKDVRKKELTVIEGQVKEKQDQVKAKENEVANLKKELDEIKAKADALKKDIEGKK